MDLATHALFPAAMVPDALATANPVVLTAAAMLGGVAPDIDAASFLLGPERYLKSHRGVMHSAGASLVTASAIALGLSAATGAPFLLLFAFAGIGHLTHVVLDLPLAWPIPALWPFSRRRFSWAFLGFGDRFAMIAVGVPVAASLVTEGATASALRVAAVSLVAAYFTVRVWWYRRAVSVVRAALPPELRGAEVFVSAPPVEAVPRKWGAYVVRPGATPSYHVYKVDAARRTVLEQHVLGSDPPRATVAAAAEASSCRMLSRRYPHLVAQVEKDGEAYLVRWRDVGSVLRHLVSMEALVRVSTDGTVLDDRLVVRRRRHGA